MMIRVFIFQRSQHISTFSYLLPETAYYFKHLLLIFYRLPLLIYLALQTQPTANVTPLKITFYFDLVTNIRLQGHAPTRAPGACLQFAWQDVLFYENHSYLVATLMFGGLKQRCLNSSIELYNRRRLRKEEDSISGPSVVLGNEREKERHVDQRPRHLYNIVNSFGPSAGCGNRMGNSQTQSCERSSTKFCFSYSEKKWFSLRTTLVNFRPSRSLVGLV